MRLEFSKLLHICVLWINGVTAGKALTILKCNARTTQMWYDRIGDVVAWDTHSSGVDGKIGGVDVVVESKFGKRHGHVGHRVQGQKDPARKYTSAAAAVTDFLRIAILLIVYY
jgi:hypothetical protein